MTKKTRIRVARIAAGAVIAAGASLTAAGAAQAAGIDVNVGGLHASVQAGEDPTDEPCIPGDPSCTEPTDPGTPTGEPTDPGTPTGEPTDPGTPTGEPTDPGTPTGEPTDPGTPTGEPTDPGTPTGQPTDEPTGQPSTGTGTSGSSTSGSTGTGSDGTGTEPDNLGSQPVEQGKPKEELAETGAGETTFLILGAATMIAGGIGFRMLPRLAGRGGNIA